MTKPEMINLFVNVFFGSMAVLIGIFTLILTVAVK